MPAASAFAFVRREKRRLSTTPRADLRVRLNWSYRSIANFVFAVRHVRSKTFLGLQGKSRVKIGGFSRHCGHGGLGDDPTRTVTNHRFGRIYYSYSSCLRCMLRPQFSYPYVPDCILGKCSYIERGMNMKTPLQPNSKINKKHHLPSVPPVRFNSR